MKKFSFLAVMALLMMFGCSKEEVINTEQETFSVEKNSQPVIDANKPGSHIRLSFIEFIGTSDFLSSYFDSCLDPNPTTSADRNILEKGNFSGKLLGIGKINSKSSKYYYTGCEKIPGYIEAEGEDAVLAYKIKAYGNIHLTAGDTCNVNMSFYLLPKYNSIDGFDGGFITKGELIISEGSGKLEAFNNKIFKVYRGGIRYPYNINLATGDIGLYITE